MHYTQDFRDSGTTQRITSFFMRLTGCCLTARSGGDHHASRITAHQLREMIAGKKEVILVDIRLPWEYEEGHIPGSISIPFFEITHAVKRGLLLNKPVVLYCRAGVKSIRTRNVLRAMGVKDVVDLAGGIFAWDEAGLETATPAVDVAGEATVS